MSQNSYDVTVAVRRPDGSVEQVRVGSAVKTDRGFSVRLDELHIGAPTGAAEPRRAAPSASGSRASGPSGTGPTQLPNYGRSKGQPIAGASRNDLEFYIQGSRRSLADPGKARFHAQEKLLLAALEAELARQAGGALAPGGRSAPHGAEPSPFDEPPLPESGPEAEGDDEDAF